MRQKTNARAAADAASAASRCEAQPPLQTQTKICAIYCESRMAYSHKGETSLEAPLSHKAHVNQQCNHGLHPDDKTSIVCAACKANQRHTASVSRQSNHGLQSDKYTCNDQARGKEYQATQPKLRTVITCDCSTDSTDEGESSVTQEYRGV